jgi:hypothetical protein
MVSGTSGAGELSREADRPSDSNYVTAQLEAFLRLNCAHQILPRRRANQRYQWLHDLRSIVKSLRRRMETAASVLAGVLNTEYPNAKPSSGPFARIAFKLFVYNFAFVLIAVLIFYLRLLALRVG